MEPELILLIAFALVVLTGAIVVLSGVWMRGKAIEMAHKERLAMIERGMVPPPTLSHHLLGHRASAGASSVRSFNTGVMFIGFGAALGMIIGFAGDAPGTAVGIGGAIIMMGAALVIVSKLGQHPESAVAHPSAQVFPSSAPPQTPPPLPDGQDQDTSLRGSSL